LEEEGYESIPHPFLPFIIKSKLLEKRVQDIKKYLGILFSKPLGYETLYLADTTQILFDYLIYSKPQILSGLIYQLEEGDFVIDKNNLSKLLIFLLETYLNYIFNNKKKKPTLNKYSKYTPKINKFLEQHLEEIEHIAQESANTKIHLLLEKNKNIVLEENTLEIWEELEIDKELAREFVIFGFENSSFFQMENSLYKYDTDYIYKALFNLLMLAIEFEAFEDMESIKKILLDTLDYPYLSNNYDYQYLEKNVIILFTDTDKKIQSFKEFDLTKDEIKNIFSILLSLYLTEHYDKFLKYYELADKFTQDQTKEMYLFSQFYTGKLTKEQLIQKLLKLHNEENTYLSKEDIEAIKQILDNNIDSIDNIKNISYILYLYPYEPKLYEKLPIEFEYKPKNKWFLR